LNSGAAYGASPITQPRRPRASVVLARQVVLSST